MASSSKPSKSSPKQAKPKPEASNPAPEKETPEEAAKPGSGFFGQVGDAFRTAGASAEKYAKMGLSKAELEKERLDLYQAHSRLGETVMKIWDESEDVAVRAGDPEIAKRRKEVREIRERMAKLRERINTLRAGS